MNRIPRNVFSIAALIAAVAPASLSVAQAVQEAGVVAGPLSFSLQAQQPSPPAVAGGGSSDAADLAKKLANPIASLISVPLKLNYDQGFGPDGDGQRWMLDIQPVVPVSLNDEWNVISRTIIPLVYQDDMFPGADSQFGMGDIVQSFFFSPQEPGPGGWIWGVGPVLQLPAATDDSLGSEKWGIGPTAVVLTQSNGWTMGLLANHIWSFSGEDDRADTNATLLQPFISYTTPDAWTFTLNTESTYDWNQSEWSIPVNLSVSKVVKLGRLPVSVGVGVRYWADSPDGGPEDFGARLTMTFLFPKG